MATNASRQKLAELLQASPELVEELRSLLGGEATPAAPKELPKSFVGRLDDPMVSPKSGKSVKYDGEAVVNGYKAIVVVYLPPEAATEAIDFELKLDGPKAQARQPKRAQRS